MVGMTKADLAKREAPPPPLFRTRAEKEAFLRENAEAMAALPD